jgi:hypothetical protein
MPSPIVKIIPSAQLQPIDLVAPGFRGLNLSQSGAVLSPVFCTEAMNAVLDASGRLAARAGVTNLSTTPIGSSPVIRTLFEYLDASGTAVPIVAWDGGIGTSLSDPAGSDVSGAVTDANGAWWFQNFNGKVLGFQTGQKLIVKTGGNFATVAESSGTAPTGGIALAAFGRVWQLGSDQQTIYYSGLLNETQWASGGAGSIDMRNIWTKGIDVVTAIWAFNGSLVVFGKRHIVFWSDTTGSVLAVDPANLTVRDIIEGTGAVSQHTIQAVGETDLLFLSYNGVQTIKRLLMERSSPLSTLTKYVRDALLLELQDETISGIRSAYNELSGFYLLSFPTAGTTWVLDQRQRWIDADNDELSVVTRWSIAPTAMVSRQDMSILLAVTPGKVGQYLGDDDEGERFRFIYASPWLDLGEEVANRIKLLKRIGALIYTLNAQSVVFKWGVDFRDEYNSVTAEVGDTGGSAEWGEAEWGEDEFAGGAALRIFKLPARGRGQYLRISIEADVSGQFGLQQAELFAKIGRLA